MSDESRIEFFEIEDKNSQLSDFLKDRRMFGLF